MSLRTVGDRLAEDLRGAAGVLNRDGWHRDAGLHGTSGSHDITGAIYVATGYHQKDRQGRWRAHALKNSAGRRSNDCVSWLVRSLPTSAVWEFNDLVCNSKNHAVDVLLAAADAAERSLRTSRDAERLLP